mmetsp:Transcript_13195/g.23744  ORF Transcript_13195/g.23744 Transcript_13195/m.23744 type:complete len:207 (+) Transcript_13195:808-1428(+)
MGLAPSSTRRTRIYSRPSTIRASVIDAWRVSSLSLQTLVLTTCRSSAAWLMRRSSAGSRGRLIFSAASTLWRTLENFFQRTFCPLLRSPKTLTVISCTLVQTIRIKPRGSTVFSNQQRQLLTSALKMTSGSVSTTSAAWKCAPSRSPWVRRWLAQSFPEARPWSAPGANPTLHWRRPRRSSRPPSTSRKLTIAATPTLCLRLNVTT